MRAPRKIIFLTRWYPTQNDPQNGIFIKKHAQAAALDNQVVVLHAEPFVRDDQFLHKSGNLIEVTMYYKQSNMPLLKKPINFFKYMMALHYGWKAIKKSGFIPDLCHVHVLNKPAIAAFLLQFQLNIPFIVSEHWSGYVNGDFERENMFSKWFTKFVLKRAARVSVVSESLKTGMLKAGLNGNYHILPNVVEISEKNVTRPPEKPFTFLTVADLSDDNKNISGIIKAFSEVYKKDASQKLVIAGDGKDRAKLEALVNQLQLTTACRFTGRLTNDDVLELIPSAHAVVINSRVETFSVLTLESIFSGRPVIATRCGGPEAFINSDNGVLIEKNNERALANAMETMKNEYQKYDPVKVKNSLQQAYSLPQIGSQINQLYDEILKEAVVKK